MNKRNSLILILILVFLMVMMGCQSDINSEELDIDSTLSSELTISDYYPFLENTIFEYEGIGNEFAERKVFFEFIDGNKAQLKTMNPGTNVVRVLENEDGVLKEIYYEGEFYHIEDMLNVAGEQNDIILMEPLKLGNSWTTADGYNRSITGLDMEIKTPMDTFEAMEVTTELGEARRQKHYYAKDIGLVASVYEDGEYKVETLLKSMENKPLVLDIDLYYPLSTDIETVYMEDQISFHTNQSIERLLEDFLKNPPSDGLIPAIPASSVINSIKLDRLEWALRVDFSRELIRDMNAGSSFEREILKSLVNTLGRFYDVENVYISLEGKPYESGHYVLEAHEPFRVDIEGIEKYK